MCGKNINCIRCYVSRVSLIKVYLRVKCWREVKDDIVYSGVVDWAVMFQTKCYGCQFPIEPGDRWVEALNQNWHSECFNCSVS